jgi:hypothetical protein
MTDIRAYSQTGEVFIPLPEQPSPADAPSAPVTAVVKPAKPIGRKAYGSIPHLPGSRLGPGDHSVHPGQESICLVKSRDKHDRVIVTEKVDGGNVAVARIGDEIVALGRAGYLASDSPFPQHHLFDRWVRPQAARFLSALNDGERVNGEWLALAHGTRYSLFHEPFVVFDMMREAKRLPWDEIVSRCESAELVTARVLSDGPAVSIGDVIPMLETSGHGALDPVEGAVWRVERSGSFDFNAKWVRPDKVDGKYITDITGHPEIWHWKEVA